VSAVDDDDRCPGGDAALLDRFVAARDADAFAEMVRRRGPLVMGVCRRVLGQAADAEDAFQATFLVLAKEARAVRRRWGGALGGWLYGTAYRIALRARRSAARRRHHEAAARRAEVTPPLADATADRELTAVLDDELNALPRRYRQPLVMYYFAGLTQAEAAERMGLHPRSLERRLAAARAALQQRLSRRGVVVSAGALALVLTQQATAAVPEALAVHTAGAALAQLAGQAAAGLTAATALVAADRAARVWRWVAWTAAGLALAGAIAAAAWWSRGEAPVSEADTAPVVIGPAAAPPATGVPSVTVRGRVVDADGHPMAGVTVLILSRPVKLYPGGRWEPIYDPLTNYRIRQGHFRELARGVTAGDGSYTVTGTFTLPDPATQAVWFQTLPFAVSRTPCRLEDQAAEFSNMQIRTP